MLPKFKSDDQAFMLLQTRWASELDPIIASPLINNNILTKVSLAIGSNNINHGLGRPLQGWYIVRQRAAATIYDTQDANTLPASTLMLTSSAAAVVDLVVF